MAHTFVDGEIATAVNLNSLLPPVLSQAGLSSITPVASTPTSRRVNFVTPFDAAPNVVLTPHTAVGGGALKAVFAIDVDTTGFTAWIYRTDTVTTTFSWQAWGSSASAFITSGFVPAGLLGLASLPFQSGSTSITPSAANTPTSKALTFTTPFQSTPIVSLCPETTVIGSQVIGWGVTEVTKAGFKAWICRTNTTNTTVRWIALGK